MKRLVLAFIAILFATAAPAQLSMTGFGGASNGPATPPTGMATPIITDNSQTAPSTSATQYIGVAGGAGAWSSGANNRDQPIALAAGGSIKNLYVRFPTTLTQGSYKISLAVNGTVTTINPLTCTIDTTHATCSDTSHEIIFSPGDRLSWQSVPTGTPTAQTQIQISAIMTSYSTDTVINIPEANPPNSATNYTTLGRYTGASEWQTSEATASGIMPTAGTLNSIYVHQAVVSGGTSFVYSIMLNGVEQVGSRCTIGAAATDCSVTGLGIAVADGDLVSIQEVPTGTPTASAAVRISVGFTPTTANRAVQIMSTASLSSGATRYLAFEGSSTGNATETNVLTNFPCTTTLKNLRVSTSTALTGSNTRTHTMRKGTGAGQSDQALTCQLNSTNTLSCSDSVHTVTTAAGDLGDWASVASAVAPSGTNYKNSSVMEGCTP